MSVLAWVVLGLIAGFIGSKIVNRRGEGIVLDILLGVVGALAGGWLFRMFGASGVSGAGGRGDAGAAAGVRPAHCSPVYQDTAGGAGA